KMSAVPLFIATIKQQMKDFPGALMAYEEAARLEPRNPYAQFNRALLLQQIGRAGEAIAVYNKVLALQPDNVATHFNLGQLYAQAGNFAAAKARYAKASQLSPKDVRALTGLALSETQEATRLLDLKRRDAEVKRAEAHFQRAIALDPKFQE